MANIFVSCLSESPLSPCQAKVFVFLCWLVLCLCYQVWRDLINFLTDLKSFLVKNINGTWLGPKWRPALLLLFVDRIHQLFSICFVSLPISLVVLCVCVLIVERIDQIMKASNLLQLQMASSPKQKNLKWSHGGSTVGGRKLLSMCLRLSAMKTQILEDNRNTMKCLS